MRMMVFCLAFGLIGADAALAQQVINPIALAPAARAALPQNGVTTVPAQRSTRYARQRPPQRSQARIEGTALIDWPWAI